MTLQRSLSTTISESDPSLQSLTAYEQLCHLIGNDQRYIKEATLHKRVGFYRMRSDLGTGNFSQVKLAYNSLTRDRVAIKILDKTKLDDKTARLLSREIKSMDCLRHPNIVRLYEVHETLAKVHIVLEFAPHGELFTKITTYGKLTEVEARSNFGQILSAVQHMHDKDIIHRDLKAENIFYSGSVIKIGDFGFSTLSPKHQNLYTFCGSPPYAAPELFRDEQYEGRYVDIWALGILLYFMVTGVMPFRAETVGKLKKCIIDGVFTIPSYVSDNCQFVIRNLLKKPPKSRLSIEDIERSDWLDGQELPKPIHKFETLPHPALSSTHDDEQEAIKQLSDLGISSKVIKKCKDDGVKSAVTGVYRIILHRVQRAKYAQLADGVAANSNRTNSSTPSRSNHLAGTNKHKSKLCTIL